MSNIKFVTRPKLTVETIEHTENGITTYTAGDYHWNTIVIESDVAPSGNLSYAFTGDYQDMWELEQVEVLNNIGNNQWECKFAHARLVRNL